MVISLNGFVSTFGQASLENYPVSENTQGDRKRKQPITEEDSLKKRCLEASSTTRITLGSGNVYVGQKVSSEKPFHGLLFGLEGPKKVLKICRSIYFKQRQKISEKRGLLMQ